MGDNSQNLSKEELVAENHRLRLELEQITNDRHDSLNAEKMEAIRHMADGVASDFNTFLTVILTTCELMADELHVQDPILADVLQIRDAGVRAEALSRELQAFSGSQHLKPEILDINKRIIGIHKMLGRLLGDKIELEFSQGPALGLLNLDPARLDQVLMNLIVNSRDAMPDGGKFVIKTTNIDLEEEFVAKNPGVPAGEWVMVRLADSGIGMSPEIQNRIFEPFFSTKDKSKGAGLGLSAVYGIVRQSGGHLRVESTEGVGTTFFLYFPRTQGEAKSDNLSQALSENLDGSETILLAEDEYVVRQLAKRILEQHGYHVIAAEDGPEALLKANGYEGQIDLLLSDVVMPGLDGPTLLSELQKHLPNIRFLFSSSYGENELMEYGVQSRSLHFLPKPFTPRSLLVALRNVLAMPPE